MNTSELTPNAQFSAFLSRFPAEIIALAKRCLTRMHRAFPGCYQLVYAYPGSLVVSFAATDRGYEGIVAVAIFPGSVRLYFDKSLPDPKGLLKGAGSKVRSVTLKSASALQHEDIEALIKGAVVHSGFVAPRTRSSRMIIQSDASKRKPRKTART